MHITTIWGYLFSSIAGMGDVDQFNAMIGRHTYHERRFIDSMMFTACLLYPTVGEVMGRGQIIARVSVPSILAHYANMLFVNLVFRSTVAVLESLDVSKKEN